MHRSHQRVPLIRHPGPYMVELSACARSRSVEADLTRRPWLGGGAMLGRTIREERPDVVHVMHPMRFPRSSPRRLLQVSRYSHTCQTSSTPARGSRWFSVTALFAARPRAGTAASPRMRIAPARERLTWAQRGARLRRSSRLTVPCCDRASPPERFQYVALGATSMGGRLHAPPRAAQAAAGRAATRRLPRHAARAQGSAGGRGRRLLRPDFRVELRLYGESFSERGYEHELRRAAGSDPRIIFAGDLRALGTTRILAELDAAVVPSIWHENLPTAGLNAIAAGVPLLVSDVAGLLELVDDYDCGFAFRRGNAGGLALLLERLVREPKTLSGIRARMGYPRSVAEEARELEALYEAIHADCAASAAP